MEDYQERVISEQEELIDKIDALQTFLDNQAELGEESIIDAVETDRMQRQLDAMNGYARVLQERIDAFGTSTEEEE